MPDDIGASCRSMIERLKQQHDKKDKKMSEEKKDNPFAVFNDPDFPFGKNNPFKNPNFPFGGSSDSKKPIVKSIIKCRFCSREYEEKPKSCANCGAGDFEL